MFDLTGKKALVTGSSRGIGRGIALAMAKQGADLCITYNSNKDEAEVVAAEIKAMGRDAFTVQVNVAKMEDITRLFEEIKAKWGKLDILVNNAGIVQFKAFDQITEEDWNETLNVDLKGPFFCAQKAISLMGKGSKIVNISSVSSGGVGIAFPMISHYTSAKAGVIGMTEGLALELGPKGINVNAIAPGSIDTDIAKGQKMDENASKMLLMRIPVGRTGKPEDIGALAVYLASDEAGYINGAVVYADGGWLTS
jgi:NAD(P)-dependent dehydrogenase (short-subunit alcohol dehydrogenase family)